MKRRIKVAVTVLPSVLLALSAASAGAQSTLGELLDAGGKKLSKADFIASLKGSTVSGQNANGATFEGTYKPDGSYTGSFQTAQGGRGGMFGSWMASDAGKICVELTSSLTGKGATCGYYYKAGETFYFSASDTDRTAPVLKRAVKR